MPLVLQLLEMAAIVFSFSVGGAYGIVRHGFSQSPWENRRLRRTASPRRQCRADHGERGASWS